MNTETHNNGLPEAMEDIRSGKIFEVPIGYFEELDIRIFQAPDQKKSSSTRPLLVHALKYWPVAASIVLLIGVAWWMIRGKVSVDPNQMELTELHDFIQEQIMEYDIETLAGITSGEETSAFLPGDTETLETYIIEHLEDFETILY